MRGMLPGEVYETAAEVASSTGVRRRGQGQRQRLARQLGAHHLDPILGEAHPVLHPGGADALEPAERPRTPIRAMLAPVLPRRRQAADVALAAVIVGRHARVAQEREQLAAVLDQAAPQAHTVGVAALALEQQLVEAIQDGLTRLGKRSRAELLAALAQRQGVLEQVEERLDEG